MNSFSSITGTFGQSQPAASDLSNGTTGTGAVVLETTPTITNPAITGGSINNTPIGQTTPAAGKFTTVTLTAATTATTANTGAASPLPTDPAGYLEMSINGTIFKLPYYNV